MFNKLLKVIQTEDFLNSIRKINYKKLKSNLVDILCGAKNRLHFHMGEAHFMKIMLKAILKNHSTKNSNSTSLGSPFRAGILGANKNKSSEKCSSFLSH